MVIIFSTNFFEAGSQQLVGVEGFLQKVTYEGHAEVKRPAHTAERILALAGFLQSYISFFNYFEFKKVCILKSEAVFSSVFIPFLSIF